MTKNHISFADMAVTIDRIVNSVFVEVDGKVDYRPEYLKTASEFYKILAFCPEAIAEDEFENGLMSMNDFFENIESGKYVTELGEIKDHPQCLEIDEYVEKKIAFKLSQMANTFGFAAGELLNTLNMFVSGHETEITNIITKSLDKAVDKGIKKTAPTKSNKSKSPIKIADK